MQENATPGTAAEPNIDDYLRLNVKACALTGGLIWGIGLFLLTWWMMAF
jgi:hypothetical protein